MKRIIFFIFLNIAINLLSSNNEINVSERTTDLVIINDVFDIQQSDDKSVLAAAGIKLQSALRLEQLTLCTKSSWFYLKDQGKDPLNISIEFNSFNIGEVISNYLLNTNDVSEQESYKKALDIFKKYFEDLRSVDNESKLKELELSTRAQFFDLRSSTASDNMIDAFNAILPHITDKIKLKFSYDCREVGEDYLLFVPKSMQNLDKPKDQQDLLLGLSYAKLPSYNYNSKIDEQDFLKVKTRSLELGNNPAELAGRILLDALNLLKIDSNEVSREMLPFLNVYLMGHGSEHLVSEIPIMPVLQNDGTYKKSYFIQVMDTFDKYFRTNTVGLSSCFIGGRKIVDTYQTYNKFHSQYLESLSFTILNMGTLYKPTWASSNDEIKKYFDILNKIPIDYEKLAEVLRFYAIDNHLNIKLPHISWFSPVELKEKSITLSQVAMSTRKKAVEVDPEKIILLGANYISQSLILKSGTAVSLDKLPVFLPSNYHFQNYYFKSLDLSALSEPTDLFSVLSKMIFKDVVVKESVNFLFETIQIGTNIYKNVHCRIGHYTTSGLMSGLSYEDASGNVLQYLWPTDKLPVAFNDMQAFPVDKSAYDYAFGNMVSSIHSYVSPALRKDFLEDLSMKLERGRDLHSVPKLDVPKKIESLTREDLKLINPKVRKYEPKLDVPKKIKSLTRKDLELINPKVRKYIKNLSEIKKNKNNEHLEAIKNRINDEIIKHEKIQNETHRRILDNLYQLRDSIEEHRLQLQQEGAVNHLTNNEHLIA